jgi:hypothetical protein
MIVEPAQQDLIRCQTQQIIYCLPLLTESVKLWMEFDINLGE